MRFQLKFDCDNEAFSPPTQEVVRILRSIADRLEGGDDFSHFRTIHDINGNDVGRCKLGEFV